MSEAVLVTGAGGFIGRALVARLRELDVPAVCHSRAWGDVAAGPLEYEGISHVYHLAAQTKVPESWSNTAEFYRTNVLGTVNVLELCRRTGATMTLSSSYVYGPPQCLPISESHPTAAFNPYSHTKLLAEEACRYYEKQFGVGISIVRPFNIYGPGQDGHFLISKLVQQALDPTIGEFRVLDARPRRDFLYVDDFVELLLRVRGRNGLSVFNAGSGCSHSVVDIVGILNSFRGEALPLVDEGQERPSEVLDVVADVSAAAAALGWRPAISLEEGLRRMFESPVARASESQQ